MENEIIDSTVLDEKLEDINAKAFTPKGKLPSKKILYTIAIVVALGVVAFFAKSYFVVAMVDGKFISKARFEKELQARAGQEAMDSLIITKLVENKVADIDVDQAAIDTEIKNTEDQLKAQGTTLEATLTARNMTRKEFEHRVTIQVKLQKLLADQIAVTDAEVTKYIKDNKITTPKGIDKNVFLAQVVQSVRQTKFSSALQQLIDSLKASAKIKYFVNL